MDSELKIISDMQEFSERLEALDSRCSYLEIMLEIAADGLGLYDVFDETDSGDEMKAKMVERASAVRAMLNSAVEAVN